MAWGDGKAGNAYELALRHLSKNLKAPRDEAQKKTHLRLLFEDQHGRCEYCSEPMLLRCAANHGRRATEDHVVARTKGGKNSISNKVAACKRCNSEKSHRSVKEYMLFREQRRKRLAAKENREQRLTGKAVRG